jgi:hypothetical protein
MVLLLLTLVNVEGQESVVTGSSSVGVVKGKLFNYEGKPAAHYNIDIIGTSSSSTPRDRVQTDDKGSFTFNNLRMGAYVIAPYLEDIDSRYPAGTSSFYNPSPTRVQLADSESSQQVTIHLGPPNRIFSGVVISRADGSPVAAVIQIEFRDDPDRFIRFSSGNDGAFRVLIPAGTQLVVKTSAPGYDAASQLLGPVAEGVDPQLSIKLNPIRP